MNIHGIEEIIQTLQSLPSNQNCFECAAQSNSWTSVNNGIFLCLKCSGIHRSVGAPYSFVRSINLDSWNESQVNHLRLGGNQSLKEFFEKYNINDKSPIDFKYKTRASEYYRKKLRASVENKEFIEDPPTLEEGLELLDAAKNNNIVPSNSGPKGSQYEPINKDKVSSFDKFKLQMIQAYDKTADSTKQAFTNINNKIKEAHVGEDIKNFGQKISEKSKEIGEKTSEKAKEGVEKLKGLFKKKEEQKKEEDQKKEDEQKEPKKDEDAQRLAETADPPKEEEEKKEKDNNKNEEKEKEKEKKTNAVEKAFLSFLSSTKNAVSKVGDKINEVDVKGKMVKVAAGAKEIGEKTSDFAKKSYDDIKKGVNKIAKKSQDPPNQPEN